MLVLSRKLGESIDIAGQIQVKVVAIEGQRVRLGIEAPAEVPIRRSELVPWPDAAESSNGSSADPLPTSLWAAPASHPPTLPR